MEPRIFNTIRAKAPAIMDWDAVTVKLIKDPGKPLTQVSELGVVHAGLEPASAVYRLTDEKTQFILKLHLDPDTFRREVANITFVNSFDRVAPELHCCDDGTRAILMEDLGDRNLAHLWHRNHMDEYSAWCRRAFTILADIQAYCEDHEGLLLEAYGESIPQRALSLPLPRGIATTLNEVLSVSRGVGLAEVDESFLGRIDGLLRMRMSQFEARHRGFLLDLTPWHVLEKDGRIRVLDLTAPPLGGLLSQFNVLWHLPTRREIITLYLTRREERGMRNIDHDEFHWLQDGLQLLECIQWMRNYCRQILEREHSFTNLDGSRPNDYQRSENAQLAAIREALDPHADLSPVTQILERYFRKPVHLPGSQQVPVSAQPSAGGDAEDRAPQP